MQLRTIYDIARQELVNNIRNKWTLIFAIVFGVLVVSISWFGIMAEGFSGVQNFTRTSASLLNLVLYIVPLVSLTMGTLSFTGDKGSMELLFAQPLLRKEILVGKVLGVFGSMVLSMLLGFSLAGILIAWSAGPAGLATYGTFVLLSLALSLAFISIALLAATSSRRKSKAFGVSVFLWFYFVLFYDVLALGGAAILRGEPANRFLFLSLFGNPVDMVRVATLILLDNATIFGASGAAMLRFFGGSTTSIFVLLAGLIFWIAGPMLISNWLIRKQDI